MSSDVKDAMHALRHAADGVPMPSGENLVASARQRRRRRQVSTTVGAVVVVGMAVAAPTVLDGRDGSGVSPTTESTSEAPASEATTAPSVAPVDPTSVLGGADLSGGGQVWKLEGQAPRLHDVTDADPCAASLTPMGSQPHSAHTKVSREGNRGNGYVVSTVATYETPEAASTVMDELASAFARCPEQGDTSGLRYEVAHDSPSRLDVGVVGTDSGGVTSRRMFLRYRSTGPSVMALSYSESEVLRADPAIADSLADRQAARLSATRE